MLLVSGGDVTNDEPAEHEKDIDTKGSPPCKRNVVENDRGRCQSSQRLQRIQMRHAGGICRDGLLLCCRRTPH